MRPPTPDELAWLNKLAEKERAYPSAGDESAAAHDCKREGWSVLAMQHRKTGKIWPWHQVREVCPDDKERWATWFPVGEQLTEKGWLVLVENG